MAGNDTNNKVGRPTVFDEEVVALLVASLQNGLNITQSCLQAGISRDAYYDRVNKDTDFSDKMSIAQEYGSMKARQNLLEAISNKDKEVSKWYLERKDPEFKPKQETTVDYAKEALSKLHIEGDIDELPESQETASEERP